MNSARIIGSAAAAATIAGTGGCVVDHKAASTESPTLAVTHLLDNLHDAAAKADADRYWKCFSPDAIFLGTDATERWTIEQFKDYAKPYFDQGRGWVYTPRERHVTLSRDATFAWFDERLNNAKYGECRGTGVLMKDKNGNWAIEQYNLSVPVPNDLLPGFSQQIRAYLKERASQPPTGQ